MASDGHDDQQTDSVAQITAPGWIYILNLQSISKTEWSLLWAKPADYPVAAIPVLEDLTVEKGFPYNMIVPKSLRVGRGLDAPMEADILTTSVFPQAFVFHNAEKIPPCTSAPNISKLCESVATNFGIESFVPFPNAKETTGSEICTKTGQNGDACVTYVVIGSAFKELLYLGNMFIHYGNKETVNVGEACAIRCPIYPLHMTLDNCNTLLNDPFNNKKNLIDGVPKPEPFYNSDLNRALHTYVFGNIAQSIRVTSPLTVAQGIAGHVLEGRPAAVLGEKKTFKKYAFGVCGKISHVEKNVADVLTSEVCLDTIARCDKGINPTQGIGTNYMEWPIFEKCLNPEQRIAALNEYVTRLSCHIAAMLFSANSALYLCEIAEMKTTASQQQTAQVTDSKVIKEGYERFYLFNGLYNADCSRVNTLGAKVFEGRETGGPITPKSAPDFSLAHLVLALGCCPIVLSKVMFYMERMDRFFPAASNNNMLELMKFFMSNKSEGKLPCILCSVKEGNCHICPETLFFKLKCRMPSFREPKRNTGAVVVGHVASRFAECELLGNYASFLALNKELSKDTAVKSAKLANTYRTANDNVLHQLAKLKIIDYENGTDVTDYAIQGPPDFIKLINTIHQTVSDECSRFMEAIVTERDFKYKDAIKDMCHTIPVSLNPFSLGFCPALSYFQFRTKMILFQDSMLALFPNRVEIKDVTVKSAGRLLSVTCNKFYELFHRKGFFVKKEITLQCQTNQISSFDPHVSQDTPSSYSLEFTPPGSVDYMAEVKIKNRIMFRGPDSNNAQNTRLSGIQTMFTKVIQPPSMMMSGPFGFLLARYHHKLFPNHIDFLRFWTKIKCKQLPVSALTEAEKNFIMTMKREHMKYAKMNLIETNPNSIYNYAQYRLANEILEACGVDTFYITTLAAIVSGTKPINPEGAYHLIPPKSYNTPKKPGEFEILRDRFMKTSTDGFDLCGAGQVQGSARWVMQRMPIISLCVQVSKYSGVGQEMYECGNIGSMVGTGVDENVARFDPRKKYVLACPTSGFISKVHSSFGNTEGAQTEAAFIAEHVAALYEAGDPNIVMNVFMALMKTRGEQCKYLTLEDFRQLTMDEMLSKELFNMKKQIIDAGVEWSNSSVLEVLQNTSDFSSTVRDGEDQCMFDLELEDDTSLEDVQLGGVKRKFIQLLEDEEEDGFAPPPKLFA